MMYDIGIIGGGTAGLTAAIYGQRAGKRTLVIEGGAFGGQITTSPKVENYPGIASVSGSEFSMNLLDQAMKLGTEPVRERVTGILEEDGIKIIVTTEREYPCKSIILATGVTHRHLGVPGEERLTGAGVSYCATCDGMFFRGKEVAVVGGGSTALQDAEFLSEYCSKVYLIHRRESFRGEERIVEGLKKKENVTFILDSVVKEICGEIQVEGLELQNLKTGEKKKLPGCRRIYSCIRRLYDIRSGNLCSRRLPDKGSPPAYDGSGRWSSGCTCGMQISCGMTEQSHLVEGQS